MIAYFSRVISRELIRFHEIHTNGPTRILAIGRNARAVLDALQPDEGVIGTLESAPSNEEASSSRYPYWSVPGGETSTSEPLPPFTHILLTQFVPDTPDLLRLFRSLVPYCDHKTRLLIDFYNYNFFWQLFLRLVRLPDLPRNGAATWISSRDMTNLLELAGFDTVTHGCRLLLPTHVFPLDDLFNRLIGRLPYLSRFDLLSTITARLARPYPAAEPSVTVVITARNERENIEPTVKRMPRLAERMTILFVEGGSSDGTPEEIDRVIATYPDRTIVHVTQKGRGQGDAMHTGFRMADTDLTIQFDSDMTIDPEVLTDFYRALAEGKSEYVMATRAIYPMEAKAMKLLNRMANWFFGQFFSWILGQRVSDTLGGVKGFRTSDYSRIMKAKEYFGDFDPFGDFDLLYGAVLNGLRVRDIPVRYRARSYGEPQISRFRDGILLFRMSFVALWKYQLRG